MLKKFLFKVKRLFFTLGLSSLLAVTSLIMPSFAMDKLMWPYLQDELEEIKGGKKLTQKQCTSIVQAAELMVKKKDYLIKENLIDKNSIKKKQENILDLLNRVINSSPKTAAAPDYQRQARFLRIPLIYDCYQSFLDERSTAWKLLKEAAIEKNRPDYPKGGCPEVFMAKLIINHKFYPKSFNNNKVFFDAQDILQKLKLEDADSNTLKPIFQQVIKYRESNEKSLKRPYVNTETTSQKKRKLTQSSVHSSYHDTISPDLVSDDFPLSYQNIDLNYLNFCDSNSLPKVLATISPLVDPSSGTEPLIQSQSFTTSSSLPIALQPQPLSPQLVENDSTAVDSVCTLLKLREKLITRTQLLKELWAEDKNPFICPQNVNRHLEKIKKYSQEINLLIDSSLILQDSCALFKKNSNLVVQYSGLTGWENKLSNGGALQPFITGYLEILTNLKNACDVLLESSYLTSLENAHH